MRGWLFIGLHVSDVVIDREGARVTVHVLTLHSMFLDSIDKWIVFDSDLFYSGTELRTLTALEKVPFRTRLTGAFGAT